MTPKTSDLHFGSCVIDRVLRHVRCGEEVRSLPPRAFDLLVYMAENPARPLTKSELLTAVWPDSFVEESSLSQMVSMVRKALGPAGASTIVTLPGRGYQFATSVIEVSRAGTYESEPAPLPPTPMVDTLSATHSRVLYEEVTEEHVRPWRSPLVVGLVAVGLVALSVAGWLSWQRWEEHVGGPPVQVVVADLEGGTGDPILDRTLINVLRIEMAQSPFVAVVSANTVRRTLLLMRHKADDPLTGDLARELCERTNSQAVLHVSVARAGSRYVLTEEATNCADGTNVATAQKEVGRVDDLPDAITLNGATLRHSLGESRRTIARFNMQIVPTGTGSLEALKDYSQGAYIAQQGKFVDAIDLLKQAVAIDPNFAGAYLNLGIYSGNAADFDGLRRYVTKAYELRAYATEPDRLYISAFYNTEITGDLYASIRDYKAWIDLYPRQPQPWSGLAEVYRQMGNSPAARVAAQRTVDLLPTVAIVYYSLADAQMRSGDFAAALATCRLAISRNFDIENVRLTMLRLGHLMHDLALIAEEEAWLAAHPDASLMLLNQANFAQSEGRLHDANALFEQASSAFVRQGAAEAATRYTMTEASSWWELGNEELARKYLHVAPVQAEFNDLLALAQTGDTDKAAKMLEAQLNSHPQSTLWVHRYAPLLQGEFSLLAHKPQEAAIQMEPSRELDGQSSDGYYMRGLAYEQAGDLTHAEAEFRALLGRPQVEPTAYQLPLAELHLARVLTQEGRRPEAVEAYRVFLDEWKNADADAVPLLQARSGLQKLVLPPNR